MAFNEEVNPYVKLARSHPLISTSLEEVLPQYVGKETLVDLGCGNGHFLQEYLNRNPHYSALGVERRFKRSFLTAEKVKSSSAQVLQGDVFEFLEKSPSQFWNEVWLQFPDPWPKARHEKNRMVSGQFLQELRRVLKPMGRFCFRSDCRSYWEFLLAENTRKGFFPVSRSLQGNLFESEPDSLYLRKFALLSIPVYSLEFRLVK